MRKPLPEEAAPTGFDLRVTHRDPHTGLITKEDPYVLRIIGESGSSDRMELLERPKGSGNLFDRRNRPIGRWIMEERTIKGKVTRVGKYDPEAEHIVFTPPATKDQVLARSLTEKDVRIAELEKELRAIQAEKETSETKTETKNNSLWKKG